jgi:hypothetical protein
VLDALDRELDLAVGEQHAVARPHGLEEAAEIEPDLARGRDARTLAQARAGAGGQLEPSAREAAHAHLRPLDVGQDPDRAHALVGRAADLLHAAQEVLFRAVAEVDPRHRHARVDQLGDAVLAPRADRGDDLGVRGREDRGARFCGAGGLLGHGGLHGLRATPRKLPPDSRSRARKRAGEARSPQKNASRDRARDWRSRGVRTAPEAGRLVDLSLGPRPSARDR